MSLLKQNIMKKRQVYKILLKLEKNLEFEAGGNKEYMVKAIIDSVMYRQ